MAEVQYLTLAEVLQIHKEQINTFGGSYGLRDKGALISALYRPQLGYYKNILEEAAALWESLSQNHPFIDGNKRTALDVTLTFLELNNYTLEVDSNILWEFVNSSYNNYKFEFKYLLEFLQKYCIKLT